MQGLGDHHPGSRVDWFSQVPTYDGNYPAEEWWRLFNNTRQVAGWTDEEAFVVVEYKLRGDAGKWYVCTKPDLHTVADFGAALRREYPSLTATPLTRLLAMRWYPGCSMRHYTHDFKMLARELGNVSQEVLVEIFTNSLQEPYLSEVLDVRATTLEAALQAATTKEDRFHRLNIIQQQNQPGYSGGGPGRYESRDYPSAGPPRYPDTWQPLSRQQDGWPPQSRLQEPWQQPRNGRPGGANSGGGNYRGKGGRYDGPPQKPDGARGSQERSNIDALTKQLQELQLAVQAMTAGQRTSGPAGGRPGGNGGRSNPQASFVQATQKSAEEEVEEPSLCDWAPYKEEQGVDFEAPAATTYNVDAEIFAGKRPAMEPMELDDLPRHVKRPARKMSEPSTRLGSGGGAADVPMRTPGAMGPRAVRPTERMVRSHDKTYSLFNEHIGKTKVSLKMADLLEFDTVAYRHYWADSFKAGKVAPPKGQPVQAAGQAQGSGPSAEPPRATGAAGPSRMAGPAMAQTTDVYRSPASSRKGALPRWTSLMCEEVMVCGKPTMGIIDTGASASILTRQMIAKYGLLGEVQSAQATSIDVADGAKVPVLGQLKNVPIGIAGHILKVDVLVTDALSYDLLLGMDYLAPLGAALDLAERELVLPGGRRVPLECGNGFVEVRMLAAHLQLSGDSAYEEDGRAGSAEVGSLGATGDMGTEQAHGSAIGLEEMVSRAVEATERDAAVNGDAAEAVDTGSELLSDLELESTRDNEELDIGGMTDDSAMVMYAAQQQLQDLRRLATLNQPGSVAVPATPSNPAAASQLQWALTALARLADVQSEAAEELYSEQEQQQGIEAGEELQLPGLIAYDTDAESDSDSASSEEDASGSQSGQDMPADGIPFGQQWAPVDYQGPQVEEPESEEQEEEDEPPDFIDGAISDEDDGGQQVPLEVEWVQAEDGTGAFVVMVDYPHHRLRPGTPPAREPGLVRCYYLSGSDEDSTDSEDEDEEQEEEDCDDTNSGADGDISGSDDSDDSDGEGGAAVAEPQASSGGQHRGRSQDAGQGAQKEGSLGAGGTTQAEEAEGTEGEEPAEDTLLEYLKAQGITEHILLVDGRQKGSIEPLEDGQVPYSVLDLVNQPTTNYHINPELSTEDQAKLQEVLQEYKSIFSFSKKDIRACTFGYHDIQLRPDAKPKACKPYRHSPKERKIIEEEVAKMLELGLIEPSTSEWASPVVLIGKKDGSTRVCLDYRYQNSQTVPDTFPLPNIEDILASLHGMRYFSTVDMRAGYYQIPLTEHAKDICTFVTHFGTFRPKFLPFGVQGGPSNYMRIMWRLLGPHIGKICQVFLDDVAIISPTFEQHLKDIETVFKALQEGGFTLAAEKCHFGMQQCNYLGHTLTTQGVAVDSSKVQALVDMPRPKNVRKLRAYLGLASYYRKYVPDFAQAAAPLIKLLKKGQAWEWKAEQEWSFQELKKRLVEAPVLAHPNFSKEFIIHSDYSRDGLGAVLSQVDDADEERVVSYASRRTSEAERKLSATEGELLAAIYACEKFRPYIFGQQIKLVVDHAALAYLRRGRNTSAKLTRWALRLEELTYEPVYRPGCKHGNVDALRRLPVDPAPEAPGLEEQEGDQSSAEKPAQESSGQEEEQEAVAQEGLLPSTELLEAEASEQVEGGNLSGPEKATTEAAKQAEQVGHPLDTEQLTGGATEPGQHEEDAEGLEPAMSKDSTTHGGWAGTEQGYSSSEEEQEHPESPIHAVVYALRRVTKTAGGQPTTTARQPGQKATARQAGHDQEPTTAPPGKRVFRSTAAGQRLASGGSRDEEDERWGRTAARIGTADISNQGKEVEERAAPLKEAPGRRDKAGASCRILAPGDASAGTVKEPDHSDQEEQERRVADRLLQGAIRTRVADTARTRRATEAAAASTQPEAGGSYQGAADTQPDLMGPESQEGEPEQVPEYYQVAAEAEEVTEATACELCGSPDQEEHMVLCDHCNRGYHTYCLAPEDCPVDDGSWFCRYCLREEDTLNAADPAEDLALHQVLRDGVCPKEWPKAEKDRVRRRAGNYEMTEEGIMHKGATEHFDRRRVVPVAERQEVMRRYHDDAGHAGSAAMYHSISRKHFWPRMGADCRRHVAHCHDCARNQVLPTTKVTMRPMPLGTFGEMWAIDSAGPLPRTQAGNTYLVVACSYYSKWPEAVAVPTLDSRTTAKFFEKEIINRYGPPVVVVHDWGTEYQGAFQKMLAAHNIQSRKSAVFHPAGNGMGERTIKTVKERLRKAGGSMVELTWDEQLPSVLWSMRMHKQASTQLSPYLVTYGREPPPLTGRSTTGAGATEATQADAEQCTVVTAGLDAALRENVCCAQERQKRNFEQRNKNRRDTPVYQRGDIVYIKERRRSAIGHTLRGPYIVVSFDAERNEVEIAGNKARWPEKIDDVVLHQRASEGATSE
jgi:hypothetical protein